MTLKDMIRSMMCCTNLPIFLRREALKTPNYKLNEYLPKVSMQFLMKFGTKGNQA